MAKIRLSIPDNAKHGDIIELKAMIAHEMESGYRRDIVGEPIARKILTNFECQLDGKTVFHADFHPGVAANPFLSFYLRAEKSGDLLFRWTEQTGEVFEKTEKLTIS